MNIQIIKYYDFDFTTFSSTSGNEKPLSKYEAFIANIQIENKNLLKTNEILNKENKDYSDQIDELKAQIQMLQQNSRIK